MRFDQKAKRESPTRSQTHIDDTPELRPVEHPQPECARPSTILHVQDLHPCRAPAAGAHQLARPHLVWRV